LILAMPPAFRFDAITHTYIDLATGAELPHITGMLERAGWIDRTFYTEESSERGTAVHQLTADYDLGALDVARCVSRYRGYLLAYVRAMQALQPEILSVEEPIITPPPRQWGGRPDRAVRVFDLAGPMEIKTGGLEKSHMIQTALQAILLESSLEVPAEFQARLCVYVKDSGRCRVERHTRRADFYEARRIIALCCDG
jgi:hypothetical protein